MCTWYQNSLMIRSQRVLLPVAIESLPFGFGLVEKVELVHSARHRFFFSLESFNFSSIHTQMDSHVYPQYGPVFLKSFNLHGSFFGGLMCRMGFYGKIDTWKPYISWEDHGFNLEQFQTPVRKEPAGDPQVLNQQVRAWLQAVFEKCSNS